ncbi:hypothetical protein MRX96_027388 [Rhipicephalus microplus]
MRVCPVGGREAGTMSPVPRENDRRLVFDPRWRRSYSASMGTKPAESSRPSFVFIQAPYEKGNAHAVERTTKKTLFEGLNVFGAAGRAGKTSTRPVLEERPGAVGVTMKELHQRVDRYRSVGLICTVVGDYLKVHQWVVGRLLSSVGSAVFARDSSAGGHLQPEQRRNMHRQRCSPPQQLVPPVPPHEQDRVRPLPPTAFFRTLVASKQNQNFMFVKALDEIKGNAYAIERTTKERLTTLLGVFSFSAAAGSAIKSPHHACLGGAPWSGLRDDERIVPVGRQASIHGSDLRGRG